MKTHKTMLKNQFVFSHPWVARISCLRAVTHRQVWIRPYRFSVKTDKMDENRLSKAVVDLVKLVARLRGKGGCPWDAKQTDATVKRYLLEEAYEAVDAIENGSFHDVCEELGDLLFQIVFLALLAEERKEFDFADVMERVTEKMIRRHPHVFGNKKVNGVEDVLDNWVKIKMKEKNAKKEDLLNNVPKNLPALLRAHRLSERAAKLNFDWKNRDEIWNKVKEEFKEMEDAIQSRNHERVCEEMGDLMFSIVNLARHWGQNAEDIMRLSNNKFMTRFSNMKKYLTDSGIKIEEATPEQMNQAWEDIKRAEKTG